MEFVYRLDLLGIRIEYRSYPYSPCVPVFFFKYDLFVMRIGPLKRDCWYSLSKIDMLDLRVFLGGRFVSFQRFWGARFLANE